MKNFNFLGVYTFVIAVMLMISSCSKDEDINITADSFVGKWSIISPFDSSGYNDIWAFYDDGSFEYYYYNANTEEKKFTDPGVYTVSGDQLTLNCDDGDVQNYKVTEYTNSRVKLLDLEFPAEEDYIYIYKI